MKKIFGFVVTVCLMLCLSVCVLASEVDYVVKLKDGYAPPELMELLTEVNKDHRLYTAKDYDKVVTFEKFIEYIEEDVYFDIIDEVVPVETDTYIGLMSTQDLSKNAWQIEMIGAKPLWDMNTYGNGVNVGVIDSGCSPHDDLGSALKGGYNVMSGANTADYSDNHGHGSHVAGIIAAQHNNIGMRGIAPKVNIYAIKVTDTGKLSLSTVANAIYTAVDKFDCKVINMSLGGATGTTELKTAVKYAYNKGVILLAAAGNEGEETYGNRKFYPASYDEVICVGAVNKEAKRTAFSQRNNTVFVVAPGYSYYSTYKNNGYGYMSGTSQATPIVAAAAAVMLSANPDMTEQEFRNYITKNATPVDDDYTGCGCIQIGKMLEDYISSQDIYMSPRTDNTMYIKNNTAEEINVVYASEGTYDGKNKFSMRIASGTGKKADYIYESGTMYLWTDRLKPVVDPIVYGN